jgi:uncharacterized protein (TIGR04255 family)
VMATTLPTPLGGPPPNEVPLPRAPLVRVIAQIRFPTQLAVTDPATVARFQDTLRSTYPILEEEQVHHLVIPPGGTPDVKGDRIWRFSDSPRDWRVSLSTGFIALETRAYDSRQDFLDRLRAVVTGVESIFEPPEAQRIGLRYIDRMTAPAVQRITELIRPEILGVFRSGIGPMAKHLLTDSVWPTEEGTIRARWGSLPARGTIDADALEPIDEASWILDLDVWRADPQPFQADDLTQLTKTFAQRVYSVFRWIVTDDFLRFYGGSL